MSFAPDPHPDDPEIPRHRHEQLAALNTMFGETTPTTEVEDVVGSTVTFEVTWNGTGTKHKRSRLTDEEFAEYERNRMAAMAYVGKHVRHFDRPFEQWRGEDLDRLVTDMLATLRACPIKPSRTKDAVLTDLDRRTYIGINRLSVADLTGRDRLHIYMSGNQRDFRVEVEMNNVPIPAHAWADFMIHLNAYQILIDTHRGGQVTKVMEYKPEDWTPRGASRVTAAAAPVDESGRDGETSHQDDSDDDLDAIEKAARRSLHGDKAIPSTSSGTTRQPRCSLPDISADALSAGGGLLWAAGVLMKNNAVDALAALANAAAALVRVGGLS